MHVGFRLKLLLASKQTRLMLLFTLLIASFITSVGLFLYYDYRSKLDKEINQPNAELLQINVNVTNRAFRHYDNKAVQLSFDPMAAAFITAPLGKKLEAAAAVRDDLKSSAAEEDIHSVYLVDTLNRQVMSSVDGRLSAYEDMTDQTWIRWAEEMEKRPLLIKRRTIGNGTAATAARVEVISLYRPILLEQKVVGLVVVNVDYDRLFTRVHIQLKAPHYIFNLDGELIYPKTRLPVPEAELRKVVEQVDNRPFQEIKLDKQYYLANQAFSDMTGWRWVSLISLDDLLANARLVRNIIIMLSLLSILVGCITIYYYSYTSFRPLKRIRELIGQDGGEQAPDDLHDVEQYIQKLTREFASKAAISKMSLPEIRSKFVQDVLFRRIGAKEIEYKWHTYFQEWSDKEPLTAVVVSINRYKAWSTDYNEEDQLLLKYALSNLIDEIVEPDWHSSSAALDKENMLLIVQPLRALPTDLESSIQKQFEKVIDMSRKYLHMQLSVGIGRHVSSITELHQSFAEANAALSYRLYDGYGRAVRHSRIEASPGSAEFEWLSEKQAREWLSYVEAGSSEELESSIRSWSDRVAEKRPDPSSVYAFADKWVTRLQQLCHTYDLPQPHELEDYTPHYLNMKDLTDISLLLLQVSLAASASVRSRMNRKEHSLVQRIIQYMKEHLNDNIGLQQIADEIQMSTSSVSSIFKQETGSTVYEYLTALRIDEACRLLLATDRKVCDIALLVGYQNETSFIRSFRKVKGTTPGKYREAGKA